MVKRAVKSFKNRMNILLGFIEVTGFSGPTFVEYMDNNNLWNKLDEDPTFSSWMEPEHYLAKLGQGLSDSQKKDILERFYGVKA